MLLSDMLDGAIEKNYRDRLDVTSSKRNSKCVEDDDGGSDDEDGGSDDEDDGFDYGDEDEEEEEDANDLIENENDSDSEEDDEEAEGHRRLLSAIESFSNSSAKQGGKSRQISKNQDAPESIFSSVDKGGNVSMDTLLGALSKTKGASAIKDRIEDLNKSHAAPTYVEKV